MSDLIVGPITSEIVTTPGTVDDVIHSVFRILLSGQREVLNKLSITAAGGTTSLSLTYDVARIKEGAILGIDLEDYYVWAVNETDKTVAVEAAHRGSSTDAHAGGTLVYVNPRYSKWQVFKAIKDELASLVGEGLFRMKTVDLTYSPSIQGYNLTSVTDILGTPWDVAVKDVGSSKDWTSVGYRYRSDLSTSEFASGRAIFLWHGGTSGQTIRVFYKSGFTQPTTLGQNFETTTGLPGIAQDIVVWGAAARLAEAREARRTDLNSQGDSRRAEEIPVGSLIRSAAGMRQERHLRIQAEIARLNALYPPRFR
jgi:hypothetical protein